MSEPECGLTPGQLCWLEIPVASASRACDFYSSVLGWDCDQEGKPVAGGRMKAMHFFRKGPLSGGFLLLFDDDAKQKSLDARGAAKSSSVASFYTESIEATLEKVEKAGGKVLIPKTDIGGGMGSFAQFGDTEGNAQGLWARQ